MDEVKEKGAKPLPDRIRYAVAHKNYACVDPDCKAPHDAAYVREDLAQRPAVDQQRLAEIRELQEWRRNHADKFHFNALRAACDDIDFLLSQLEEQK